MRGLTGIFGGMFAAKAARETRITDLLQKNALLRAELDAERHLALAAEASERALQELLAAEKLRNADLKRRLDAAVCRLDARDIEDLNNEKEGPKRDLEKFNDAQAARAMSRNTKQAFVVYQGAVKAILDQIDTLGQKNHVTKEDLRKLRQIRADLSETIGRTL